MTTLMNLDKERKVSLNLDKNAVAPKFKNLLVTVDWSDKKKGGGELDLDLMAVGKRLGVGTIPAWGDTNPDDILFYKMKQSNLGKLTADNLTGASVDGANANNALKNLGVSAYAKIKTSFDEAMLLNIENLNVYDEVYISITSFTNEPFSLLEAYGTQPVVSISFYDADLGVKVGSDWSYSQQILPDGTGFVLAKLTKLPRLDGTDISNDADAWYVKSLASSVKEMTGDGKVSIDDVIESIRATKI